MTERPTPETDALVPSQGRIRTMREYIDELEAHARRLERQRDEWKSIAEEALISFRCTQLPEIYPEWHWSRRAQGLLGGHAIAAVKGATT